MAAWLDREVSPGPTALVRVGVGAAALLKGIMAWGRAGDVLAPGTLRAPWSEGLAGSTPALVSGIILVWLGAALAFTLGWRTRWAGWGLAGCIVLYMSADRQLYQNHVYLLLLLVVLLSVARSDRVLALDARRTVNEEFIPAWPLDLFRLQITLVYLFGGLSKINPDFLSGGVLAGAWRDTLVGGALVKVLDWRGFAALALGTVVLEVAIGLALWLPRRRKLAVVLGILMHLGIMVLMPPRGDLTVFTLLMFSGYVLFLAPQGSSSPLTLPPRSSAPGRRR